MAPDEQQPAAATAEDSLGPPSSAESGSIGSRQSPPERRRRPRWRYLLHALALVTALVAALLVTIFTIDLGPYVKARAEAEGSKWLDRPMTIGRINALLRPGYFEFHDVVIQGLRPTDRPFLRAEKITVAIPWWTIFNRELIIQSVELTGWDMFVEMFPGGRHNFPRVQGPPRPPRQPGPRPFVTTLRQVTATGGTVTYIDHGTPWQLTAPNMRVTMFKRPDRDDYGGTAAFDSGRVRIQNYEEFGAAMRSTFSMKPPLLHFDRIDLTTDGAQSVLEGDLHLNRWPEQLYRIRSTIDIATQKDIYFARERFDASGTAEFQGTFHYFKGGRELKGAWQAPLALVELGENTWRFPNLHGNVLWVPDRLEVTDARSAFYGGTAAFDYRLLSLDNRSGTRRAVWDVKYDGVSLAELTDFLQTEGIRLAGRGSGRNRLEWPLGEGGWDRLRGGGELTVVPPAGVTPMTRELPAGVVAEAAAHGPEAGPFNRTTPLGYVPVAGHVVYALDPRWITLEPSWVATPKTYVGFEGRTAYTKNSRIPFHVTSADWQEADRVFAGILTAFGSPTGAVPVGGHGEFTGVMLGAFTDPRIEGTFSGDQMRAWDVLWGRGSADVAIEDSYVTVTRSSLRSGDAEINATGRFSLGYPRRDKGEEVNAQVEMTRWPMSDLRRAFELHDWPIDGYVSGQYTVTGNYERPFGSGTMVIDEGVAYGETFDRATSTLRFEGNGVRLERFEVRKATGRMAGSAWVGWDNTYSFTADGEAIPVESLKTLEYPRAPLSGTLRFKATGAGSFDEPRYDVTFGIVDLFARDEGIGHVTGHLGLRGELLTVDFEAASPRLAVSGAGRIAMTDEMDADLTLRFSETSLDPYVRFFEPRLSPFTNAVAGGTVRVTGELANPDHLLVEATVESLDLTLFDYAVRNEGPIELALERNVAHIRRLELRGDGTQLGVGGSIDLSSGRIDLNADGDANLGILQGFFRSLRSSGAATLAAGIGGTLEKPVFSGRATIANGRIRHFAMPRSLDAINGAVVFDAGGIRIDTLNPVTATLGGGSVTFGGRIAMAGFVPGELALTATGERMRLNYPEGFRSEIDADLTLRGDLRNPLLTGDVTVREALYTRRFETTPNLFNFGGQTVLPGAPAAATTVPLRFDIQVDAPGGSIRVNNNIAQIEARADLRLLGTYDRPVIAGYAEITRGDINFEGNNYDITRGRVDFSNPTRIEPYFDLEAETRARVGDQTYRVTVGVVGTTDRLVPTLTSDPPLAATDVLAVLLGQDPDLANAELRAYTNSAQTEADLIYGLTSRLLASPFSQPVGQVAEQVLGKGTTVLITPRVSTEGDVFATSARLVIGKRLSQRMYITFARLLGGTQPADQIITLEFDQSDRVGWILTRNGDSTYAIDFRVRHVF